MTKHHSTFQLPRFLILAALLLACAGLEYGAHIHYRLTRVYPYVFCAPLLLAAVWWGLKGGLLVASLLGLLHVAAYLPGIDEAALSRAVAFVCIGSAAGVLSSRRKQAEERVEHLNRVLRAIRSVNRLISRERDRDTLLKAVCDNLVESRGYHNAWIALLDEAGRATTTAEAGLGEAFLPMAERLKSGALTHCARRAVEQSGAVAIEDPPSACADCPLAASYRGRAALTARLECRGRVYGLLSASVPARLVADDEELSLFGEVAADIALALHNMQSQEERERAEEEVRSLARFPSENPHPVLRVAGDGTVLHANAPGEALLSDLGCGVGGVVPDEWRELVAEVLTSGSPGQLEAVHADRLFAFRVVPVQEASYVNWYGRDITKRRQAEQERERLSADLRRRVVELDALNKELESFSHSVSHDLRAPLRALQGFGRALLEDCGDVLDEQGKHYVDRIRAGCHRMSELIEDLLRLSRVTAVEMSHGTVDLSEMAREVAAELRKGEPKRRVECMIADGLMVEGDRRLLRILLRHLLGNAWKFTSKHPAAAIELGATHGDDGRVFFVRDDGAGFDMAYAHKLFAPFQRLHPQAEFPGTGIGLATVQRIVRRHGGSVWVEAAVEQGATFYFTL